MCSCCETRDKKNRKILKQKCQHSSPEIDFALIMDPANKRRGWCGRGLGWVRGEGETVYNTKPFRNTQNDYFLNVCIYAIESSVFILVPQVHIKSAFHVYTNNLGKAILLNMIQVPP